MGFYYFCNGHRRYIERFDPLGTEERPRKKSQHKDTDTLPLGWF